MIGGVDDGFDGDGSDIIVYVIVMVWGVECDDKVEWE